MDDYLLVKLVLEGKLFVNKDFSQFSIENIEGYKKWSEVLAQDFKGYSLNDKLVLERTTAPTLNFKDLITLFKMDIA